MKKQVVAGLMVAVAMVSFGCSGRNAEFGVVDMKAVESKAEIVKTVKEAESEKLSRALSALADAQDELVRKERRGIHCFHDQNS